MFPFPFCSDIVVNSIMAKIYPYIFPKNAKATIDVYKDVFGAKLVDWTPYNEQMKPPFDLPKDFSYEHSTLHAVVDIMGVTIALGDNLVHAPGHGNVEIVLELDSKVDIERIVERAKARGFKLDMELQKMFWGGWYAKFNDDDGIGWQLNYQEDPMPPRNVPAQTKTKPVKKAATRKK